MQLDLNLATRRYINRRTVSLWLTLIGLFLTLLLVLSLFYSLQNYRQMAQIDQNLDELNKQLAQVHGVKVEEFTPETYAEVMKRVDLVNQMIDADHFRWTELLGRFETLLPDDVSIVGLQPTYKDKSLKISARARTVTDMTEFLDRLMATDDFKDVVLFSHAVNEEPQQNGIAKSFVAFSIEIREAF